MKRKLRGLLAVISVLALTLGISVCGYAAEDIVLNGDEAGGSSLVGEFSGSGADYKYLGYVTTKGATSEYKYLEITYTGDIRSLRVEFNREDDSIEGPYWFNKENQSKFFQTVDGSAVPLSPTSETTVKFDLEAMGVDIGEFVGMHLHYLDPNIQEGSFTIVDAKLMTDENGQPATEEITTTESVPETTASVVNTDGTDGTAGGSVEAPSTGFPIWPVVIVVAGAGIAAASFVVSKKFKK